jgi:ribosomal-protein-alanine N-acetyltransferase
VTPEALAELHALCFTVPRPFSVRDFTQFLTSDLCFLIGDARGFALGQVAVDEVELLTLAVHPDHRRAGLGRNLLRTFETEAFTRGAHDVFLEVSAENPGARRLYDTAGYRTSGARPGYYRTPGGGRIDAILMTKPLIGP